MALTRNATVEHADTLDMLSFQKLRVYQRSIEFLALTMDVIAALPKGVMKLIAEASYRRGIDLLEAIVGMLTKMT